MTGFARQRGLSGNSKTRGEIMKLPNLAVLFAVPALLLAQEATRPGDETQKNAIGATETAPGDSALASNSPAGAPAPLTDEQKVVRRLLRLAEPVEWVSSAAGAAIEQWRNMPPAWRQGSEGYGRRFGSAEGFIVAHNAVALGSDVIFHLDPRYRRMPEARFKSRLWNAVSQTFIANKDSGGKTLNVSELVGNFGAGFIANTWEPARFDSTGDALTRGALGLAYHTAKNVAREFLPGLLHRRRIASSLDKDSSGHAGE